MDNDLAFKHFLNAAGEQIKRASQVGNLRERIVKMLHPGQRRIFLDKSRFKAVVTSRRFGKSIVAAAMIVEAAMSKPGTPFDPEILYIADTAENARSLLAKNLHELKRHIPELEWEERSKNSRLYFVFPNGCTVWAAGVPDKIQVKVFRGFDYRAAVIDEAQNVPERILRPLLGESIMPALTRTRGWCLMIGTPGQHKSGLFFECTSDEAEKAGGAKGWTGFVGKMWENPFLFLKDDEEDPKTITLKENRRRFEKVAEEQRVVNGWSADEPAFLREYYGLWRTDAGLLAFPYSAVKNFVDEMPEGAFRTIMGADIGTKGTSAFVIIGVIDGREEKYVLHSEEHEGVDSTHQFCAIAKKLYVKWNCKKAIVDPGGLGGAYIRDMKELYGIKAEEAKKNDKLGHVKSFRGELERGNIKLVQPSKHRNLLAEWAVLCFDREGDLWSEDDPDHLSDAALYAWRHIRSWAKEPPPPEPEAGSAEWFEAEARRLRDSRTKMARKRVKQRGWVLPR